MTPYERGFLDCRELAAKEVPTDDTRELCCKGYDCECRKPEDAAFVAAEIEARRIKNAILSLTPEGADQRGKGEGSRTEQPCENGAPHPDSQPDGVVVPREPTEKRNG